MTTALDLNDTIDHLWRCALPYLDTRHNALHTRISFDFAVQLLEQEEGDPLVVLPAIILHDVGWKRISEHLHPQAFGPKGKPQLNRIHEEEGVNIARELLKQTAIDGHRVAQILTIIDGHDSRIEAISQNDRLVKDADKLWRYSREGFAIDLERFNETYPDGLKWLRDNLPQWLFTAAGRQMALEQLAQREREMPP
jgi:HD superfamily phosphodiesterase